MIMHTALAFLPFTVVTCNVHVPLLVVVVVNVLLSIKKFHCLLIAMKEKL